MHVRHRPKSLCRGELGRVVGFIQPRTANGKSAIIADLSENGDATKSSKSEMTPDFNQPNTAYFCSCAPVPKEKAPD